MLILCQEFLRILVFVVADDIGALSAHGDLWNCHGVVDGSLKTPSTLKHGISDHFHVFKLRVVSSNLKLNIGLNLRLNFSNRRLNGSFLFSLKLCLNFSNLLLNFSICLYFSIY